MNTGGITSERPMIRRKVKHENFNIFILSIKKINTFKMTWDTVR